MASSPLIFCAIDTPDLDRATNLARAIGPVTGGLKLGLEFFNAQGPQGIAAVLDACPEARLFLDLKFHDIPNTVAGAVRSICRRFSPMYINVHASGGRAMMRAAKDAALEISGEETAVLAVTLLTSLGEQDIEDIGYEGSIVNRVLSLARLAKKSGMDGVVCSPQEIETIRSDIGGSFVLMTPGIRPAGSGGSDDQVRVMTPHDAVQKGVTHMVIGRPITQAESPENAARAILSSINGA